MLSPGDRIGERFVVEALVGQGGLAEVYRVRHVELGTVRALKLLVWNSPKMADRLVQEGRIQAQLQHPNVVSVSDIVRHEGKVGLIMDYVEHETLESYLARHGAVPLDQGLKLFASILSALIAAHAMGVLHRDIKPGNVMLAITPDGLVPKVADFGIAKAMSEELRTGATVEGTTMGSPGYLAPEQVLDASSVDERTDIFALGVVAYEILTGVRAFGDERGNVVIASTLRGNCPHIRTRKADIPESIANAIMKAMSLDRNDRQPNVRTLAEEMFAEHPERLAEVRGPPRARSLDLDVAPARDPMPTLAPRSTGASSGPAPTLAPGTFAGQTVGSTMAPVGSEFLDATAAPTAARSRWAIWVAALIGVSAIAVYLIAHPERTPVEPAPRPTAPVRAEPSPEAPAKPPEPDAAAEPATTPSEAAATEKPIGSPTPTTRVEAAVVPTNDGARDATDGVAEATPPEGAPDEAALVGSEATDPPVEPAAETAPTPPPETTPAPSPQGTWAGRANNRTFALTLDVKGTALAGSAKFANPGGGDRTLAVTGTYDPANGKMTFAAGDEFDFQGVMMDGSHLTGNYKPRGSNKSFAWNVER
jgi:eukaryotic-like serine/threonine-protein kinase